MLDVHILGQRRVSDRLMSFWKDRKKKSSREEKSENQLLRRPSMKKIKAFFDKDKNKENKEDVDNKGEKISDRLDNEVCTSMAHKLAFSSDYASAVSKLPSLDTSAGIPPDQSNDTNHHMGGSKSVPSSLDRKQRYKDSDYAQV